MFIFSLTFSMIPTIVQEFNLLIDKALCDKDKGWQFKVKNYRRVVSILKGSIDREVKTTEEVLELLRQGGMQLPNETPPQWRSKILIKVEKILTEGSLNTVLDEATRVTKELCQIPGIGPSKAKKLYQEGITSINQLITRGTDLINEKQKIGLRHYQDLGEKIPRDEMDIWETSLLELCKEVLGDNILKVCLAGSFRRGLSQSGDIDCYLCVKNDKGVLQEIYETLLNDEYIVEEDIFSLGKKKMMAVARLPFLEEAKARHLDVFVYPEKQYPFAILYATGSGEFNVKMRNVAIKQGYSLSDQGIKVGDNKGEDIGPELIHSKIGKNMIETEMDIFRFLEMEYIEPKDRTPTVEIKFLSSSLI